MGLCVCFDGVDGDCEAPLDRAEGDHHSGVSELTSAASAFMIGLCRTGLGCACVCELRAGATVAGCGDGDDDDDGGCRASGFGSVWAAAGRALWTQPRGKWPLRLGWF
eukprot:COSAG04_NODE_9823_length_829_cov_1.197260_1_plen_107_part_01